MLSEVSFQAISYFEQLYGRLLKGVTQRQLIDALPRAKPNFIAALLHRILKAKGHKFFHVGAIKPFNRMGAIAHHHLPRAEAQKVA